MFEPIVITEFGDTLIGSHGADSMWVTDDTDDTKFIGDHASIHGMACRGLVRRLRSSDSHDALLCHSCFLRVSIPREVESYGEIRRHFSQFNRARVEIRELRLAGALRA